MNKSINSSKFGDELLFISNFDASTQEGRGGLDAPARGVEAAVAKILPALTAAAET